MLAMREDVIDGGQAVAGLRGRDVVNVRLAAVAWLGRNVARQRCWVVAAGEAVAEWRRLNHALVSKMLMGRRNNGEARRGTSAMRRQSRRLGRKLIGAVTIRMGTVALCRLLQTSFDNVALLFTNAQAALELLLHDRVLRDKARGQAGQANLLDSETISSGQRKSRGGRVAVECVFG